MDPAIVAVVGAGAAAAGTAVGWIIGGKKAGADADALRLEAESHADDLKKRAESEARAKAREIIEAAEEKAAKAKRNTRKEVEGELKSRRVELDKLENRLNSREEKLDSRASSLDSKQSEIVKEQQQLARMEQSIGDRARSIESRESTIQERLEAVAGLSREEAREQLVGTMLEDARLDASKQAREIEEQALGEAEKRAKKILAVTVQRYAGEYVTERCVRVVNLPSDDMKGRIIGREGRNIRAIEAATGVDLIIDDTPNAIVVSSFDGVRREVARQALERLMADGRIHPARIEEVVAKTNKEMDKTLRRAGEQAIFDLGLTDVHPEIVRTIGRLKYRTSYGQNIWAHSIEVGFLCGLMAGELGLNVKMARRAGLLHDIGKAMDHEQEGGHAIIGANFIKKHGEEEIIVNAVAAHHEEVKPASVIAHLVMAGDALSGARPGARREILESYVQRLEDLERISASFNGVQRSFAIQAGREVRVIVEHDKVNDDQAAMLSREIARKIEDELTYPGQIRVTVIREVRASEIAR